MSASLRVLRRLSHNATRFQLALVLVHHPSLALRASFGSASQRASARRRMSRRSRAAAEADLQSQFRFGQPPRDFLHYCHLVESQKLRLSRGHRAHPVSFETSAVGIAVASGLACRKPSDSSTCSRVPSRCRTSTSVALRTSRRASPTTTLAAALTPRATAPGTVTSPSNFLTSNELSISSAISNQAPVAPSRSATLDDR